MGQVLCCLKSTIDSDVTQQIARRRVSASELRRPLTNQFRRTMESNEENTTSNSDYSSNNSSSFDTANSHVEQSSLVESKNNSVLLHQQQLDTTALDDKTTNNPGTVVNEPKIIKAIEVAGGASKCNNEAKGKSENVGVPDELSNHIDNDVEMTKNLQEPKIAKTAGKWNNISSRISAQNVEDEHNNHGGLASGESSNHVDRAQGLRVEEGRRQKHKKSAKQGYKKGSGRLLTVKEGIAVFESMAKSGKRSVQRKH